MTLLNGILIWLAAINLLAFWLAAVDKRRAVRGGRRIREATLLGAAAAGGGVGLYVAMVCLRHKTKKMKFMLGVPGIILLHILLVWFLPGLL